MEDVSTLPLALRTLVHGQLVGQHLRVLDVHSRTSLAAKAPIVPATRRAFATTCRTPHARPTAPYAVHIVLDRPCSRQASFSPRNLETRSPRSPESWFPSEVTNHPHIA